MAMSKILRSSPYEIENPCKKICRNEVIINIDIDTTGLNPAKDQICRIFAFNNEEGYSPETVFSIFLMPTCAFTEEAARLNGFKKEDGTLCHYGEEVEALTQEEGYQQLRDYITLIGKGNCILISHNAKGFLAPFLVNGFKKYLSAEDLSGRIRFADSLPIIKIYRSTLLARVKKLATIHNCLFPNKKTYNTPNARNDAIALNEILSELKVGRDEIIKWVEDDDSSEYDI